VRKIEKDKKNNSPSPSSWNPDRWVVIEMAEFGVASSRKVLAGWTGGYLSGDSWRLSSQIVSEKEFADRWEFSGSSGSLYVCRKSLYGLSSLMAQVWVGWCEKSQTGQLVRLDERYQPTS
jgi:hypothetical protein